MAPTSQLQRCRRCSRAGGFTMIELLVVAGVIAIMAAVALPSITGVMRTYKIRGATQDVAGEMQAARSKAIMKNANERVVFSAVDADTYRYYMPDANPTGANPAPAVSLGPMRDLPAGIRFVAFVSNGVGFDRLGRACRLGATGCDPNLTAGLLCPPQDRPQCNNRTPGNYVGVVGTEAVVRVRDPNGLERTVSVAPGGRVRVRR